MSGYAGLAQEVGVPGYTPSEHGTGIVHIGLGAFHRGHMAVYTDDVLGRTGGDWRIAGVSLRSPEVRDRLAPQNCYYTLVERGADAEKLRIIGSISEVLVAPEDPEAVLQRLCDPGVHIVSFTITEKGYLRDSATGNLLADHPDIRHDLGNPQKPCTMHGFVVEALARRKAAGLPPVTLLCCDNLPANGKSLKIAICAFARLRDAALADWIENSIAFPCTMVDRIVPATTGEDVKNTTKALGLIDESPVICEPFRQWVIEDNFNSPRPAWEDFGAIVVADVEPYEEMKLRLLNGSHSSMAYLGYLAGIETIDQVIACPEFVAFVRKLMAEAITTLHMPEGLDLEGYCDALIERFRNPSLKHRTWQIAMDGSQKLPQRLLNSIRSRMADGKPYPYLAMGVAGWLRYVTAVDEQGHTIDVSDPLANQLKAIADAHKNDTEGYVQEVVGLREVFGDDLAVDTQFQAAVLDGLKALYAKGSRAAIREQICHNA